MDIRQLRYLIALVRERHFARAAEACAVTQPTLSARIRQLEEDLGVQIVLRGKRYHGLTREGERVLAWARRIVEEFDGMRSELALTPGGLTGRLSLGVIPSALAAVPPLAVGLRQANPKLRFEVLSRSSNEIARQLEEFQIDAGITYLDNGPIADGLTRPLFTERYRLFLRGDHPLAARESVTWAEAAAHPLCALTPDMQNRRIVDSAFRQAGEDPEPVVESNSLTSLCAFVEAGGFACVLPEYLLALLGKDAGLVGVPLAEPKVEHLVGLTTLDRSPLPARLAALLEAAERFEPPEIVAALERRPA